MGTGFSARKVMKSMSVSILSNFIDFSLIDTENQKNPEAAQFSGSGGEANQLFFYMALFNVLLTSISVVMPNIKVKNEFLKSINLSWA